MKRNVVFAGVVLMVAATVARAEAPAHSSPPVPRATPAPMTEAQKQAKLFQLVNACLAERPGAPSAADEILKKFRQPSGN